jgi:hypothetical protein
MLKSITNLLDRVEALKSDTKLQEHFSYEGTPPPGFSVQRVYNFDGTFKEELLSSAGDSLDCVNCGKEMLDKPRLFCSNYCKDYAWIIRYLRHILTSGAPSEEQMEAIEMKLLHVYGSKGYEKKERRVPPATRQFVFVRDGYTCQICGTKATEIDHISGSSSDVSNLRALCSKCNKNEVYRRCTTVTLDTDPVKFGQISQISEDLALRIASEIPLLICDDINWDKEWRGIFNSRKESFENIVENIIDPPDGYDIETIEYEADLANRDD